MTPTHPRHRAGDTPFVCQACTGPCRVWAGPVWRWTCRRCQQLAILDGHNVLRPRIHRTRESM